MFICITITVCKDSASFYESLDKYIYFCITLNVKFDWDENKNQANISEHDAISFSVASKVFNDVWAIDENDLEHSTLEEQRFTIIGLAETQLLRVTYTIVSENPEVIRIISARKAKGKDKLIYEQFRNKYF
jgi:uncharacterized protein